MLMKKCFILLMFLAMLIVSGCGAKVENVPDPSPTSSAIPDGDGLQNDFSSEITRLKALMPSDSKVNISDSEDGIVVTVTINGEGQIPYLGNYFYDVKNECDTLFDAKYYLQMMLANEGHFLLHWNYPFENYAWGRLNDKRSGSDNETYFNSLEDVYGVFPALQAHVSGENNLNSTERQIFNEVSAALDAQPDRAEEEIFEEMAPKYGMTADELRQFMFDMMDKIY